MRLPAILEPLRHRDFRLLWTGQTLSRLGDAAYFIAIPLQLLAIGGTPVELGLVIGISATSRVALLLVGGPVVDRISRRAVLITTDLTSGLVVATIALLAYSNQLTVEHLYVAAAIFGVAGAFFIPAIGAIIPDLVPAEVLVSGNALRGFSRQAGLVIGPVLAGAVIAVGGPPLAFAFDAITFGLSLFALLFISSRPLQQPAAGRSIWSDLREGWHYTFSVQWLWVTIFAFALINAAVHGPVIVGLPVLVVDVLRVDQSLYGLAIAATGLGEVLGAVATSQIRRARTGTVMYLYVVVEGLAVAGIALVPTIVFVLPLMALRGYCIMASRSCGSRRSSKTSPVGYWGG